MQAGGTNDGRSGTGVSDARGRGVIPRSWLEAAGWILLVALLWGADLLAKMAERDQAGFGKDDFRLISEQVTSALAALIMILFVIRWLRLFPLRRAAWAAAVIGHTAGSILFAFGHYALTVALRMAWYGLSGVSYVWREPFVANLIVEYQKDIKIYLGIVAVLIAYRRYTGPPAAVAPGGERLVVQTGSAERILRFDEIDYLEAARNYVSVHADGQEYVVRDTVANLVSKLSGAGFARCHRSFIVNLGKIREIRTEDARHRIVLDSGRELPLSRGYRDEFRALLSR